VATPKAGPTVDGAEAEDLLASALELAKVTSNAAALPRPMDVPLGRVVSKNPIPTSALGEASLERIQAGMVQAVADQALNSAGQFGTHVPASLAHDADKLREAYSQKAPESPAAMGMVGGVTFTTPASVRVAPANLHSQNPASAHKFWQYFLRDGRTEKTDGVDGTRARMAMLAAKKNFLTEPFVFLSQAIWPIFELDSYYIKNDGTYPEFTELDADKAGSQYDALVKCFGMDNARVIHRDCERGNVSICAGIELLCQHILQKHEEQLAEVMGKQTVQNWT
jgi:hypothetical protein